jgi:hypothetical protein
LVFSKGIVHRDIKGPCAKRALDQSAAPVTAARKNEKEGLSKPDRIVAAPSGDMAYEYGSAHVSFDDAQTG